MPSKLPPLIILFLVILLLNNLVGEEPWSISKISPVTTEVYRQQFKNKRVNHKDLSNHLIFIFQKYISPLDGSSCHYNPTCSRYAAESFQMYGTFKGTIMTIDRIIRCHDGQREHFYDPPTEY